MTAAKLRARPADVEIAIDRIIDAPRERVFEAWTDEKQMAAWWGPEGFTNPVCEVDARPGGALRIVMRAPDGTEYPMSGTFNEVVKPERIVFTAVAEEKDGTQLLEAYTVVTFAAVGDKTRVTVKASAIALAPGAMEKLKGMKAGWTGSLECLARLFAEG